MRREGKNKKPLLRHRTEKKKKREQFASRKKGVALRRLGGPPQKKNRWGHRATYGFPFKAPHRGEANTTKKKERGD